MPKRRNSKRTRTGGDSANPGSYSDAASYALATAGSGNTQYANTFDISRSQVPGNALVGLQGQTVGGRRRRSRSRRRSRKGGVLGGIISNALAPATLLAMQQSYKRKKGGKGKRRSRKQKGGLWSGIISKAAAPFTLLAMQQSYRRKKSGNQTRRRS